MTEAEIEIELKGLTTGSGKSALFKNGVLDLEVSLETVRQDLKSHVQDKWVWGHLFAPQKDAKGFKDAQKWESHRKFVAFTEEMNSTDAGNLFESWQMRMDGREGDKHVALKKGTHPVSEDRTVDIAFKEKEHALEKKDSGESTVKEKDPAENTRESDELRKVELQELKFYRTELRPEKVRQIKDFIAVVTHRPQQPDKRLGSKQQGSIVEIQKQNADGTTAKEEVHANKLVVVFGHPKGTAKNLDHIEEFLNEGNGSVFVQVFNTEGHTMVLTLKHLQNWAETKRTLKREGYI